MAKRGISGQINMFDFFSGDNAGGEVEMVSLFPGDEPFEDISDGDDGLASGIQEFGEVKKELEAKPVVEPKPVKKTEAKPAPKAEPEKTVESKPVAEKPKKTAKPKAEPKAEPMVEKPKPTPKVKAEPKPEPQAEEPVVEETKTEPEAKSEQKVKPRLTKTAIDDSAPVMHKEILDAKGKVIGQIAFRNYNRVCLQLPGEEMKEYQFNSSKEAVDFYMGEIWKLTKEE